MRVSPWCCAALALVAIIGCSRGEEPPAEPEPAAVPAAEAEAPPMRIDAPGLEIEDDDATIVVDGFQFFVQPAEPDVFEIDADASQFLGYAPMLVDFGATALNGTPPVTYSWNFGDGSPPGSGDRTSHLFEKTGRIDVFVTGKDGAGDEATVQLAVVVFSREEWAKTRGVELDSLPIPTARPYKPVN